MIRPALASLTATLLAAAGAAAFAQVPADTPPAPPAAAAPAPAATPAPPPAATPAPAAVPPAGAVSPAAPPAALDPAITVPPPPGEPPAPPPPPPAPPPPEALYAIQALEKVCAPLIQKADLKATTKAGGFRNSRGQYTMKLDAGKTIILSPPSMANPQVCRLQVTFPTGEWRPMVEAFNAWAYGQTPQLIMLYQGFVPLSGDSTTWSWEITTPMGRRGLAFNVIKGNKLDTGHLLYTDTLAAGGVAPPGP